MISALLPFLGASAEVAWLTSVISILLALAVAVLKEHLTVTVEDLLNQNLQIQTKLTKTISLLVELNGLSYKFGITVMDRALHDLERISNGKIPLSPSDYFQEVEASLNEVPSGSAILAVNCIDELRWIVDPRQKLYLAENLAAGARGVKITRIFIVERGRIKEPENSGRVDTIKKQLENVNIDAQVVWRETLIHESDRIRDWVYFSAPRPKLYIDYPDRIDGTRIAHADLIINPQLIETYLGDFRALMTYTISKDEFLSQVNPTTKELDA